MYFILLLWIICVIYVLYLSCFRVCSLLPCGYLLGRADLLFVMFNCLFDTFPCSILGKVWYLIVFIPDLCRVASSIPARSRTFVEIDHEIISTVILLPSAESFKKGCCQLQAKVCARSTG